MLEGSQGDVNFPRTGNKYSDCKITLKSHLWFTHYVDVKLGKKVKKKKKMLDLALGGSVSAGLARLVWQTRPGSTK